MDKISISAIEKVMKEEFSNVATVDWHGNQLIVQRTLPLQDMLMFVSTVVDSCFNKTTSEFIPEAKDFALMNCIVEFYANVRLPESMERRYDLLYRTDLIRAILDNVNDHQFNEMVVAINAKVRNRADSNAEKILRQFASTQERFEELAEQVSELFSGVTNEDLTKLAGAVADGSIDEEKIVRIVMEQQEEKAKEET